MLTFTAGLDTTGCPIFASSSFDLIYLFIYLFILFICCLVLAFVCFVNTHFSLRVIIFTLYKYRDCRLLAFFTSVILYHTYTLLLGSVREDTIASTTSIRLFSRNNHRTSRAKPSCVHSGSHRRFGNFVDLLITAYLIFRV